MGSLCSKAPIEEERHDLNPGVRGEATEAEKERAAQTIQVQYRYKKKRQGQAAGDGEEG
jgi:hypothetical protein